MLNSPQNVQVSDTTDDDSSNAARPIKIPFFSTAYPEHPNIPSSRSKSRSLFVILPLPIL